MRQHSVIGHSTPRVDAAAKVTGEAVYTMDMSVPGMLQGAVLRSPYPHARILNLDAGAAARLPGVKAVLTGRDLLRKDSPAPAELEMAVDYVRYMGEAVAAVAAVDQDTAREALNLIKVEYQELPAVFDLEAALRPGSPSANLEWEDNLLGRSIYNWGDIDKGFHESEYRREDKFSTQIVHPGYMEPPAAVADFDSSGHLTFWCGAQVPETIRASLAGRLGVKMSDVRVILPYVGGAHCGKIAPFPFMLIAAILSEKSGRPVKMFQPRDEILIESRGAAPWIIEMKMGVKRDGTLTALQCRVLTTSGPFIPPNVRQKGREANQNSGFMFATYLPFPYRLPHIRYEGRSVLTNKVFGGQRGTGRTPARFAYECQLDMIAADLGIDPIDIRKKNALREGDITANGGLMHSSGLVECLEKVAEHTRWRERKGKAGLNRGLGAASYSYHIGSTGPTRLTAAAVVMVQADGTASLNTGHPELGQGSETVMSQIVAEELGLSVEDVRVNQVDTSTSPYGPGASGSFGTYTVGHAVKAAAEDARRQVMDLAAVKLGVPVGEMELRRKAVWVRGSPQKMIPLSALAREALNREGKLIVGQGQFTPEWEPIDRDSGNMDDVPPNGSGAFVAEVEVDRETGQVKVVRLTVAHDCGCALNPAGVEGQLDGQVHQGMGQALYEEHVIQNGMVLNKTFTDYRMPRSLDMPQVEHILVEIPDPRGLYGAKECSEGPLGGVAPAIANAVYDAVGVRINDLPVTPEKVLKALKEKGAG